MIYIMLSQIDFLFIRVIADLVVTIATTEHFLRNKEYDKEKFAAQGSSVCVGNNATSQANMAINTETASEPRSSLDVLLPT